MSQIEWDENKRRSNVAKHGFDFVDAEKVLFGVHVRIVSPASSVEQRWLAVGKIRERFVTVVYTVRDGLFRIISMRSARKDERRKYQALYGG